MDSYIATSNIPYDRRKKLGIKEEKMVVEITTYEVEGVYNERNEFGGTGGKYSHPIGE